MRLLYTTHPLFLLHDTGPGHPERPARLGAVEKGLHDAGLGDALVPFEAVPASDADLDRVHDPRVRIALSEKAVTGGGHLDADTVMSEDSYDAAVLAAGAGLEAVRRLQAGEGDVAFCAVRPPGHHATPRRSMGFCLVNNVAVVAAALAGQGERVLVVDYDAHHGNGTQDVFWDDPRVTYVSFHEYPLYPGTGSLEEMGGDAAFGSTVNIPLPAGATGDVYRRGFDEIIAPLADAWQPTWLLVSAGYDAHRRDPLTGLALRAGDYADLTRDLAGIVPGGRTVVLLEGGYDLEGLTMSVGASLGALAGVDYRPEGATDGGPGAVVVEAVRRRRDEAGLP